MYCVGGGRVMTSRAEMGTQSSIDEVFCIVCVWDSLSIELHALCGCLLVGYCVFISCV